MILCLRWDQNLKPGLPVLKANLPTATPKVSTFQTYLEYSETIKITFICQIQYHKLVVEATLRTIRMSSHTDIFHGECLKDDRKAYFPKFASLKLNLLQIFIKYNTILFITCDKNLVFNIHACYKLTDH